MPQEPSAALAYDGDERACEDDVDRGGDSEGDRVHPLKISRGQPFNLQLDLENCDSRTVKPSRYSKVQPLKLVIPIESTLS